MIWHNKRVATLNFTFQLLDIYRYKLLLLLLLNTKTLFHRRGTYSPSPSKTPNAKRGMEEMGGVPLTLGSHAQKVETIGRSVTSSEIYFICTNVSAIGAATENLGL